MSKLAFATIAAATVLSAGLALAQVQARQGEVQARQGEPEVTQFRSPMILDLPLKDVSRLPKGAGVTLAADLSKYRCEDVSLSALSLKVKERADAKHARFALEISGYVHVPPSRDRLVDLTFAIKKDGATLATGNAGKVDAEEDRNTKFKTVLYVDEAALQAAFAAAPPPTLELTVRVSDSG